MPVSTRPEDATLLDLLVDGFEKNEVMRAFHWRILPMAAVQNFLSLADEPIAGSVSLS